MTNKTALETLNNVYIANLESEITRLTKENEELQRRNKDLLCSNGSLFNHIYDNRREVKRLTLQLEKAKELIQDIFTYGTVDDNYSFHHDSSLAHQLRAFLTSQSPEPSKDVEDEKCPNCKSTNIFKNSEGRIICKCDPTNAYKGYHVDPEPHKEEVSAEEALEWLAREDKHLSYNDEINKYYVSYEQRNQYDLSDWVIIGEGPTPLAAIRAAIKAEGDK